MFSKMYLLQSNRMYVLTVYIFKTSLKTISIRRHMTGHTILYMFCLKMQSLLVFKNFFFYKNMDLETTIAIKNFLNNSFISIYLGQTRLQRLIPKECSLCLC